MKGFTKSELKTGMKVVLRDGSSRIVLKDVVKTDFQDHSIVFIRQLGYTVTWLGCDYYSEDLIRKGGATRYDVMEVHCPRHIVEAFKEDGEFELIWKREEKSPQQIKIEELEATIRTAQEQIQELKKEV